MEVDRVGVDALVVDAPDLGAVVERADLGGVGRVEDEVGRGVVVGVGSGRADRGAAVAEAGPQDRVHAPVVHVELLDEGLLLLLQDERVAGRCGRAVASATGDRDGGQRRVPRTGVRDVDRGDRAGRHRHRPGGATAGAAGEVDGR